jgi:hypothetical protein
MSCPICLGNHTPTKPHRFADLTDSDFIRVLHTENLIAVMPLALNIITDVETDPGFHRRRYMRNYMRRRRVA